MVMELARAGEMLNLIRIKKQENQHELLACDLFTTQYYLAGFLFFFPPLCVCFYVFLCFCVFVYLLELLEALFFIHAHKIVHRDVKPENILIV